MVEGTVQMTREGFGFVVVPDREDDIYIPQKYMRIETAMTQLGFIGGYQVFKRWELVAQKKPKPRKPVLYDFNIIDFEKKHKAF